MLMFCLINILLGKKWKEFKLNYIELELLMFAKFIYILLMIKGLFLMMVLTV